MEKGKGKAIKRVVLIGPESTGKTELATYLADCFGTVYVPEYAREYIESLDRNYTYEDVEKIALKQIELEAKLLLKSNEILFYDTFLIITKIWFKIVYHKIPSWIDERIKSSNIDLFLLCNTDLPWMPDKVRENGGEMREKLFDIYKQELDYYNFNYEIVEGIGEQRFANALKIVQTFIERSIGGNKK